MSYPSYPTGNEPPAPPPGASYGYGAPGFQEPRANQKGQIGKSQGREIGSGQALAGIILGSVTLVFTAIYVIFMVALGFSGSFSDY